MAENETIKEMRATIKRLQKQVTEGADAAQVAEEAFGEWAQKYAPRQATPPEPRMPMPAGVKNFHLGGGAPTGAKKYRITEALDAYHSGQLAGEDFRRLLEDGKIDNSLTAEMLARHPEAGIRGFNE